MSGDEPGKPSGMDPSGKADVAEMVGDSWPGMNKRDFDDRHAELDRVHRGLTSAKEGWQAGQSHIGSENNWAGVSATIANAKADTHTKAMEGHEQQLTAAKGWSQQAGDLIVKTKETIVHNVNTAVNVMKDTIEKSDEGEITSEAAGNIRTFTRQTNEAVNKWAADTARGKESVSPEPPSLSKEEVEEARDKRGDGEAESNDTKPEDTSVSALADAGSLGYGAAGKPSAPAADVKSTPTPPKDVGALGYGAAGEPQAPVVLPQTAPANPGKTTPTPTPPPTPGVPTPASSGGAPNLSGGGTGASGAPSPLSGGLGGSGAEQAASASPAAGQAPVGGAPTDPLQAFSKGFADSAGTPVHAASTGAPPLAPAPTVPASDAMAPASTHSAPASLSGAQAPVAPVQGPPAGGSMGMGGGMPSMPLGPPPTAPPAAPVAPPPAVAPPAASPANIAGGAQIAPIPVSAARAERDAAQNAARRTGSDPLEQARRIGAALNAPDMVNESEDFFFHWITAVTDDGRIVVANNFAMAYIPEKVRLPGHVVMASADESIPPSERARWATYPAVALQSWAQHHGAKLRAFVGFERHFTSDSGVHQVFLTPEDIPASGKMVGRDRLQVIAPDVSSRLAQIGDADLVKLLPPAPVDATPPDRDERWTKWEKVWERVLSRSATRGEPQLKAYVAYATYAQECAVYEAHTAMEVQAQRRAVEEFIYWQHIGQLTADALEGLGVGNDGGR